MQRPLNRQTWVLCSDNTIPVGAISLPILFLLELIQKRGFFTL
jgi:hypothetical protein